MKLCPSYRWNFKKHIRLATYKTIKTTVVYLIFRRVPKCEKYQFCKPSFQYRWKMKSDDIFSQNVEYSIDFSKNLFRNLKNKTLNQFALSHFEHFSPFSKDSKIPGTEPKHVKTSFLKACLEICMENIQCEELKDQLTHRRS